MRRLAASLAAVSVAACTGTPPPASPAVAPTAAAVPCIEPPAAPPRVAVAEPGAPQSGFVQPGSPPSTSRKVPTLRLGHYSSGDGLTGFVLDRTGAQPKVRLDGTSQVLVLDVTPAPFGQIDVRDTVHHVAMRFGTSGEVTFFRGPRGDDVKMIRDADADPL